MINALKHLLPAWTMAILMYLNYIHRQISSNHMNIQIHTHPESGDGLSFHQSGPEDIALAKG